MTPKVYVIKQCGAPIRIYGGAAMTCSFLRNRLFTSTNRRRKYVRIKDFTVEEWRGTFRRAYYIRSIPHLAEIELCEKRP